MLVLTTEEVHGLVDPLASIQAIEAALSEPDALTRQSIPRRRLYVPTGRESDEYYWHNNMAGAVVAENTLAVRLDVSRARVSEGGQEFPGDFSGLVLLYDLERAMPYAIIHDHGLSPIRVAATSAIASKALASPEARVLGIIGTGEQAVAHASAHLAVTSGLSEVLYSSRSEQNRQRAVDRTLADHEVTCSSVADIRELVDRSDIVVAATNASAPVLRGVDLRAGQHVVTIASSDGFAERREIDDECFGRADVIVVNSREQIHADRQGHFLGPQGARRLDDVVELTDLLSGAATGRSSADQITLYDNNVGLGIQFAAVGALAYRAAVAADIGTYLPASLFMTRKADGELYAP